MKKYYVTYPVLAQNGKQKSYSKFIRKAFFIAFCLHLFLKVNFLWAQVPLPPSDSYINIDGNLATAFVGISDSSNTSEIEILLGSKGNDSDLFSHSFVFDQASGLPTGITYSRSGLQIFLGLGSLALPPAFNVKVRIKDSGGNFSPWLEYVTN